MTDILIGTHSRNSWQRPGTTATLRIWFSGEFRDTNGVMITPGNGTSSFYMIVPCTVNPSTHIVTIPPFTLPSTLDGTPAYVLSYGRLYDESGAPREFLWSGWSLSNLPTSLPFNSWFIFNQGSSLSNPPDSYLNRQEVIALIDSLLTLASQGILPEIPTGVINGSNGIFTLSQTPIAGSLELYLNGVLQQEGSLGAGTESYTLSGNVITHNLPPQVGDWLFAVYRTTSVFLAVPSLASTSNIGITELSYSPVNPLMPIALSENDPRVPTQGENDALVGTSGTPGTTNRYVTEDDPHLGSVSVLAFGALADGVMVTDGSIQSGFPTLTSLSSSFSLAVIGKSISVVGAGAAGATLTTTILARPTATTLTLATNASTTVASARVIYGTSNATFFQAAVDAALALGVPTVYVPKGLYFFPTGSVDVPDSVALVGATVHRSVHSPGNAGGTYNTLTSGDTSTFVITANEGSTTGYFIRLGNNSVLRSVTCYYPAQILTLATPKLYPYFLEMRGAFSHAEDIELGLPYRGIFSVAGDGQVIRNVAGQPLSIGLRVSQIIDCPLYENVRFETNYLFGDGTMIGLYPVMGPIVEWVNKNGTAFLIGRVDNGVFYNIHAFGYWQSLHLVEDAADANGPGGPAWAVFVTPYFGSSPHSIVVDKVQGTVSGGAESGGVTFIAPFISGLEWPANPIAGQDPYGMIIEATATGDISIVGGRFSGLAKYVIWYKEGATLSLGITNSQILEWVTAGLKLEGPPSSGEGLVSVVGCRFFGTTAPVLQLSGRMSGMATGNTFATALVNTFSASAVLHFNFGASTFSDGSSASPEKLTRIGTPVLAGETAWSANYKILGVGGAFGGAIMLAGGNSVVNDGHHLLSSAYFDGTNWRYAVGLPATNYSQFNGMHVFRVAPAGTANNVVPWVTGLQISSEGIVAPSMGAAVASASAIVPTGNLFHITGVTTITSITGTNIPAGARITMIFDSTAQMTDGSNLKLAGNFTGAADRTITGVWDGTNFYEVARSAN